MFINNDRSLINMIDDGNIRPKFRCSFIQSCTSSIRKHTILINKLNFPFQVFQ